MSLSLCPDMLLGSLKPDEPMAGELQSLSPGLSVFGDRWLLARPSKDQTGGTSITSRGPLHGWVLPLLLSGLGDGQTRGHKGNVPPQGCSGAGGTVASGAGLRLLHPAGLCPQEAVPTGLGICGPKSRGKGQGDKNRAIFYAMRAWMSIHGL